MIPRWKVELASCLREGWHEIRERGMAFFLCLEYEPTTDEKEEILSTAEKYRHDVWWSACPRQYGPFQAVLCCGALREDEEE